MTDLLKPAVLAIALLGAAGTLAACEEKGPAEEAGEHMDDAMEDMGDAMEDMGN